MLLEYIGRVVSSLISFRYDKTEGPRQLIKERICLGLWIQRAGVHDGGAEAAGLAGRTEAESSQSELQLESRGYIRNSVRLSSTGTHFLQQGCTSWLSPSSTPIQGLSIPMPEPEGEHSHSHYHGQKLNRSNKDTQPNK